MIVYFQMAVRYANEDAVAYADALLEAGANPNTLDNIGNSPLTTIIMRAFRYPLPSYERNDPLLAELLLSRGMSPDLVSVCVGPTTHHFNGTALKKAVLCQMPVFVDILLQAGADPDIPGQGFNT